MAKFKEKTKASFEAVFWDGTKSGFSALPKTIKDQCALIDDKLVYITVGLLHANFITAPMWIISDNVNGITVMNDADFVAKNIPDTI